MMDASIDSSVDMATEAADLCDAVGALYQASLDPQLWPIGLARVCRALGLRGMALSVSMSAPTGCEQLHASHGISADAFDGCAKCAGAQCDGSCIDPDPSGPALHLAQDSAPEILVSIPLRVSGASAARVVLRHARSAHSEFPARAFIRIRPHLERALEMALTALAATRRRRELERDADCMPFGRFTVEANLRIVYANRAGRAVARQGDGLQIHEGYLRARRATDHASLVAAMAACGRSEGAQEVLLTVPRRSGRWPYAVRISSAAASMRGDVGQLFEVLVVDRDPEQDVILPLLVHGFDLTPAENRVLQLLMAGLNIEQIADRAGIARGTAKIHLQHVLEKLGVHRQADIVKRVLQPLIASIPPRGAMLDRFDSEVDPAPAVKGFDRDGGY